SEALIVGLDVTGSMGEVVEGLHKNLPALMRTLHAIRGLQDMQILFMAVGDARHDQVPFQISQFESDNRIDDCLAATVIEGGGGSFGQESYEIALYAAARLTSIDCFEKRKKKGYLFLIGDELPYAYVSSSAIARIFGHRAGQDIPFEEILTEAQEKYEVFFIIPVGSSGAGRPDIREFWQKALGTQHVITLSKPELLASTIAGAVRTNVVISAIGGTTTPSVVDDNDDEDDDTDLNGL
ncbi:hypothetical protein C5B42_00585, partial [Candidatus Cerribacteria bacterium 'Amazon FNV 2010 28 9']